MKRVWKTSRYTCKNVWGSWVVEVCPWIFYNLDECDIVHEVSLQKYKLLSSSFFLLDWSWIFYGIYALSVEKKTKN